jgi:hypothetical protein
LLVAALALCLAPCTGSGSSPPAAPTTAGSPTGPGAPATASSPPPVTASLEATTPPAPGATTTPVAGPISTATTVGSAASGCHYRTIDGRGPLPDAGCTPGATNPSVSPGTIQSTICVSGWTSTVRPPASVTEPQKLRSMAAYGATGSPSAYEYDHLIPLELGGAVDDGANLWPQPSTGQWSSLLKDRLENRLRSLVCRGELALATAQRAISSDWTAAYQRYG